LAAILPFTGIRYSPSAAPDLDSVVSPPYDIISPDQRKELHERDPHNFVRLVLGEELPGDDESSNRFTRAGGYLQEWIEQGVLARDPRPSLYAYQQRYKGRDGERVVSGLLCLVKVHDYADRVILPHEQTLAKPKSGLLELMRRTRANLDSVYSLTEDRTGTTQEIISETCAQPPTAEAHDLNGELHSLWMIDNPRTIQAVQAALADQQIVIADGHHRYETALAYRDEMRGQNPNAGSLPSDYVLMTLVDASCPDLTIFPTHRVVRNVDAAVVASLLDNLRERFRGEISSQATILEDIAAAGPDALGAYLGGGRAYVLRPRDDRPVIAVEGEPEAVRRLSVSALHRLALEECLGIGAESLRNEANVTYTRDEQHAFDMVDAEGYQAAFFLNPAPVRDVIEVAKSGSKMPQKATYFYPKLLSGLALRSMDDWPIPEVAT